MRDLIIVGAGGFAREVHAWLPDVFPAEMYRFQGFLGRDDGRSKTSILADPCEYVPQADDRFILAIGNLEVRRRVAQSITDKGGEFINFVHPTSVISPTARIGRGAVIFPYSVVSNEANLGAFVHLSLHASVGHDAQTGDNCYLAPYATMNGESAIGDDVLLGSHVTILSGIRVGSRTNVSANTSVVRDAPGDATVFGVPGVSAPRFEPTTKSAEDA